MLSDADSLGDVVAVALSDGCAVAECDIVAEPLGETAAETEMLAVLVVLAPFDGDVLGTGVRLLDGWLVTLGAAERLAELVSDVLNDFDDDRFVDADRDKERVGVFESDMLLVGVIDLEGDLVLLVV